jgi:hypothetical protein
MHETIAYHHPSAALALGLCVLFGLVGCGKKEEAARQVTISAAVPSSATLSSIGPLPAGAQPALTSTCNLEAINLGSFGSAPVTLPKEKPFSVSGWAVDEKDKSPGKAVYIALADQGGAPKYFGKLTTRTSRPDVGQGLKISGLVNAGFEGVLGLEGVEPGTYRVLLYIERSQDFAVCENGRTLIVLP